MENRGRLFQLLSQNEQRNAYHRHQAELAEPIHLLGRACLLYTSDAADELDGVDLGGRRIIKKIFFFNDTATTEIYTV